MTVEINLSDDDYKTISEYVAEKNFSLSEFLFKTAIEKINSEKISDEKLLDISNEIIKNRAEVYEALAK